MCQAVFSSVWGLIIVYERSRFRGLNCFGISFISVSFCLISLLLFLVDTVECTCSCTKTKYLIQPRLLFEVYKPSVFLGEQQINLLYCTRYFIGISCWYKSIELYLLNWLSGYGSWFVILFYIGNATSRQLQAETW